MSPKKRTIILSIFLILSGLIYQFLSVFYLVVLSFGIGLGGGKKSDIYIPLVAVTIIPFIVSFILFRYIIKKYYSRYLHVFLLCIVIPFILLIPSIRIWGHINDVRYEKSQEREKKIHKIIYSMIDFYPTESIQHNTLHAGSRYESEIEIPFSIDPSHDPSIETLTEYDIITHYDFWIEKDGTFINTVFLDSSLDDDNIASPYIHSCRTFSQIYFNDKKSESLDIEVDNEKKYSLILNFHHINGNDGLNKMCAETFRIFFENSNFVVSKHNDDIIEKYPSNILQKYRLSEIVN